MNKVYIVYDIGDTVGIYSTRELAQAVVDQIKADRTQYHRSSWGTMENNHTYLVEEVLDKPYRRSGW